MKNTDYADYGITNQELEAHGFDYGTEVDGETYLTKRSTGNQLEADFVNGEAMFYVRNQMFSASTIEGLEDMFGYLVRELEEGGIFY